MAPPMEIRIESCDVDDGPAVARNSLPAFWEDPSFRVVWKGKPLEHVVAQAALRGSLNLLRSPEVRRHQKAVDTQTGALVGYARWVLPDGIPDASDLWPEARVPPVSEERRKEAEAESASADWIPGEPHVNVDEPAQKRRDELLAGRRYLQLHYLAVHPQYQRRGIATALVKSGVAAADRMGMDCFVAAFKEGCQTYYNAGFVLLDEVVVDYTPIGGDGLFTHYMMERRRDASAP